MIPLPVLERGEQAFVSVLRGDFPDCCFLVHDAAVRPEDSDVAGQVAACATVDFDAVDKPAQDAAAAVGIESLPVRRQRPARRKRSEGGG
jgi:hypothetical protein